MSHFVTLVLVDSKTPREDVEDEVHRLLAPYDEDGEWFREGSRWDRWMIGGRFTGWIDPGDIARASEVHKTPFALITPDGRWYEAGRMGWFDRVSDEKDEDEWQLKARALIGEHPDAWAVVVDCHV
jgi:hypothetical protein